MNLSRVQESIQQKVLLAKNNVQKPLDAIDREQLIDDITKRLKRQNTVLVAHYYVDEELQKLAEETGGIISDSLEMAAFGKEHPATTLIVCGVRFMGETAKILSPEKCVLMPNLQAECSLDLGCPAELFKQFRQQHQDRTAVVYANTSAEVKAIADWTVTSSNAVAIIQHLHSKGEKILWAPDRHLGNWVQAMTQADLLNWDGHCVVHDEFRVRGLTQLLLEHPDATVIAHPESPQELLEKAVVIGSTKVLINAVNTMDSDKFIVATDEGIFYKMQQLQPQKQLIVAPTGGKGATCTACGHCPWMALNDLRSLQLCLQYGFGEITIDHAIVEQARQSIQRMMQFSQEQGLIVQGDA